MSKPSAPTYRTSNWRSYNAALRQRGSLVIWFDPETEWLVASLIKLARLDRPVPAAPCAGARAA